MWNCNKLGHEVLSFLRTEYENQCNHYAQEVRVVSEANSSRTVKEFEARVEALMTEVMDERLKTKFMDDDIEDMKLELDDRDGLLQQLQREEAAVQASMTGAPKGVSPSRVTITERIQRW